MKIPNILITQSRGKQVIGGIYALYAGIGIYQGLFNTLLIAVTAYNTTLRSYFVAIFPWFNFITFLIVAGVGNILIMIIHYKFIVPSIITYGNQQAWKHNNLGKLLLEEINSKCDKLLTDKGGGKHK